MLRHRVPSAVVMVLGLLAVLWADGWIATRWGVPGLLMVVALLWPAAALASREIAVLLHAVGVGVTWRSLFAGATAGLGLCVGLLWYGSDTNRPEAFPFLASAAPGVPAVVLGWLVLGALRQKHSAAGAIHLIAGLAVGFVFLGLLVGSWLWVRVALGPFGLVYAVMVIKCCDIGAYFTGRFLGRHKLILWLSPGKTWEGLVGGMLFSGLIAVALSGVMLTPRGDAELPPWWFFAVSGAALGYVGQLGDLFASALKRDAGVKDFAKTIPGFGGVMDVIDSLVLAGPVVLVIVWLSHWV